MNRIQRRLLIDTGKIGITLTFFIVLLDLTTRVFEPLENLFYDRRARVCQLYNPPPTDKLAHVDIDDPSLEAIGRWPWPRSFVADLIDEIDRAGAKAIAMDVLFPETQDAELRRAGKEVVEIDHDAVLADAIARCGKVLVPVSLTRPTNLSPVTRRVREYLEADLELSELECQRRLEAEPTKLIEPGQRLTSDQFVAARREAMGARIAREMESGSPSLEELRKRLLPRADQSIVGSPQFNTLAKEYQKYQAIAPLRRFMLPLPPTAPRLADYDQELAPIPALSKVAASSGYVDYLQNDEGGVIRTIPLFAEYRGALFPQMDLVLACTVLGVDVGKVKVFADRVVIPKPPGHAKELVIPVRNKFSPTFGREIGAVMDIPVYGRADWTTMYDHPHYARPALHTPASYVWDVKNVRQRLARNNASIDKAISTILDDDQPHKLALDPTRGKAYAAQPPPAEDFAARRKLVEWVRGELKSSGTIDLLKMTDKDLADDAETRVRRDELAAADAALTTLLAQNEQFEQILAERRAKLKERLGGRVVLIGWAATGRTDIVTTPIQPACPGVVVHGLIFNAIMTGEFWRQAPAWVTAIITVVLGLAVTAANGFLRPSFALATAILLAAAYLLVNGFLLFDYGNWCVGVAAPMTALATVWSTGALAGFLIESTERARITKRFAQYNDPKLVNYVQEHPDVELDGEVREMSVVFTDLAGFTTLSERLRERTVPILSEYLGHMVPIIRRNNGLVNKFLGDGIMCFFNAPENDRDHAYNAVVTCIEMQRRMAAFAEELTAQGLPRLAMRCGVSTGTMVVGDSGPSDGADYTVLGDAVNFGSRLEGANKATGTNVLISERTGELVSDRVLLRPVGRLQVVGKTLGVMAYEPVARLDDATPEQRELVAMCAEMVAAYAARDFQTCIDVADRLDVAHGHSKLADLYRKHAREYLENPPGPEFTGSLVLTEK